MIIEPTPTHPSSPIRRVLRVAGLALPVVLLAAAVGAGLLGPKVEPPPPAPSPAGPSSPAVATPGPSTPADEGPAPPDRFADLAVEPVAAVLARAGAVPDGDALAVSGYLRVDGRVDGSCDGESDEASDPLGPWCAREAILVDAWWTRDTVTDPFPPHLHLLIPAGVRLPPGVLAAEQEPDGGGARVVAIVRPDTPDDPCGTSRSCGERLVVERFAWVDGVLAGVTPLLAEPLRTGTSRPNPFAAHLGTGELPLAAVLDWPDGIARIDPAAAPRADAEPSNEPLWYVRVLGAAAPDGTTTAGRTVRWMLLAERDLRVVAQSGPAAFPATTAGLPVLTIPDARTAMADTAARPIAVAGYLVNVRPPDACPAAAGDTRGVLSPLCERSARLSAAAGPDPGDPATTAHLHVRIPPGVRLPGVLEDGWPDGPVALVLIGRPEPADEPCPETARGCHDRFVADRVAWAGGEPFDPGPVFDAGLIVVPPAYGLRRLDEAEAAASAGASAATTLVAAVVRPATVARLDPVAAAAMARGPQPGDLVWYVRTLAAPGASSDGGTPAIAWAVVDEASGVTLARGTAPG